MAKQIGIIIEREPDGFARIITNRKSACGGCHTNHGGGCRSCLANAKMEIRVANPIGARKGDVVEFTLRSEDFFKGAAMLYLLPILALIAGALCGAWAGALIGLQETAGAVAGSAIGIAAAVYALVRLDRSRWVKRRLAPRMTEVISRGDAPAPGNTVAQHACCGR